MCGIVAAPTKYKQYSNEIEYRGPDATKELIINDYTFIFHRLAIMDTSHSGDQPFFNDSFALMCNGEIYNVGSDEAYSILGLGELVRDELAPGKKINVLGAQKKEQRMNYIPSVAKARSLGLDVWTSLKDAIKET